MTTHVEEPPGAWTGMLPRLADLPRAIEARPAPQDAPGLRVIVAVTDAAAPWNEGVWRITRGEGRPAAERTTSTPELSVDAAGLAPIYNGFTQPAEAARVGQLAVHEPGALGRMARMVATPFRPFCPDDF
jgi:predicted acetyltransferase